MMVHRGGLTGGTMCGEPSGRISSCGYEKFITCPKCREMSRIPTREEMIASLERSIAESRAKHPEQWAEADRRAKKLREQDARAFRSILCKNASGYQRGFCSYEYFCKAQENVWDRIREEGLENEVLDLIRCTTACDSCAGRGEIDGREGPCFQCSGSGRV